MGRSSKLQLARRSAYCRRADVRVWSKRVWGFDTMLRTCLVVDIIEYPTPSSYGGAPLGDALASSPSLHGPSPPSPSRTSTLTVGRGGERPTPQDSTAPPRLLHRARVSRADTAQRQGMTVRPSTADSLARGDNRICRRGSDRSCDTLAVTPSIERVSRELSARRPGSC